ncbi:MAG: sigma-70 family RNA polymerase sigma factor [Planctomycetaceae bacterium]|nr:sigma-70 family RNA polymerase sigma factor [Planctomycetaceae bacterium]
MSKGISAMTPFSLQIDRLSSHIELVRRAQAGEQSAMGELFTRFRPVVLAVISRRVRDVADAEELAQDVFVKMIEKLDQLRQPEAFPGWIKQIAVRLTQNFLRRRVLVHDHDDMIGQTEGSEASPLANALVGERESSVREGLGRLRDMDREALEAFYIDGKSILEIADQLDAPVGTIKRRLHVARQRLAGEVQELAAV